MWKKIIAALAIVALASSGAYAATIAITQGAGTNMLVKQDGSGNSSYSLTLCDATNPNNCAPVDVTKGLTIAPYNTGCAGVPLANTTVTAINTAVSAQIVTGTVAQKIHICEINIAVSAADNVALVEGSGSVCVVGTAGLFGGATAGTGWNFAAATSLTIGNGHDMISQAGVNGDNLCLIVSTGAQISGNIVTATF